MTVVALLDQLGELGDLTGAQVGALGGAAGGGEQQAGGEGDHGHERGPGRQTAAADAGTCVHSGTSSTPSGRRHHRGGARRAPAA